MALSLKRALLPTVCRYAFSNFQVDIYVNVLEDDGSVLAAAITVAGLALADAGKVQSFLFPPFSLSTSFPHPRKEGKSDTFLSISQAFQCTT